MQFHSCSGIWLLHSTQNDLISYLGENVQEQLLKSDEMDLDWNKWFNFIIKSFRLPKHW